MKVNAIVLAAGSGSREKQNKKTVYDNKRQTSDRFA